MDILALWDSNSQTMSRTSLMCGSFCKENDKPLPAGSQHYDTR